MKPLRLTLSVLAACMLAFGASAAQQASPRAKLGLNRPATEDVVYFVLPDRFANGDASNDRGGLKGGPLQTGFDPTHKGYFHGGDLKGLTSKLDYIQGLGATAIWLGPIYKNKPVQGPPGEESAGYHGYWVLDFTDVDPHFGTRADLKALVDAAHSRGMKVYLDIITNHTADVIQYRECPPTPCHYRSVADYPYNRQGGVGGPEINPNFKGADDLSRKNFAGLSNPNYAYTVVVPPEEAHAKTPEWLNNPIYYHNRGNSNWVGEGSVLGDFSGLDDVFTEHPRVVQGFIDIYGAWIDDFGIDGFRVDTAKHVNPEFWRAFIPAMEARARKRGIPNFYIFGEVYDQDVPGLARATRVSGYRAVLDYALHKAQLDTIAGHEGSERLGRIFELDVLYAGGDAGTLSLPTFTGNHDIGRIGYLVKKGLPEASEDEVLQRALLAHALIMFSRGVPVLYYGDEQGFVGEGGDQDARQDMFASQVTTYNRQPLMGRPGKSTASENYDPSSPIYQALANMTKVRAAEPALRHGAMKVRSFSTEPGLFAFSRILEGEGEVLVVMNTSAKPQVANIKIEHGSSTWRGLVGVCPSKSSAPGSIRVAVPSLGYLVCASKAG